MLILQMGDWGIERISTLAKVTQGELRQPAGRACALHPTSMGVSQTHPKARIALCVLPTKFSSVPSTSLWDPGSGSVYSHWPPRNPCGIIVSAYMPEGAEIQSMQHQSMDSI